MPRKTKEPDNKEISKKTAKTVTKKGTSTKKNTSPKKELETKKETVAKKKVATKKTTTKKAASSTSTKKDSASTTKSSKKTPKEKTSTVKKATKKRVTKKATIEPKVSIVEYYDLPYRYHQTVVKLLAQTPNNLFIYWDISDTDCENLKKQYGDNFFEKTRPILIVHNDSLHYSFEVEINDFANSWYLQVKDSDCHYHIELGRRPILEYTKQEPIPLPDYFYIATSNSLITPNNHVLFTKEDVVFRNVKTKKEYQKSIASFLTPYAMEQTDTIINLYQKLYKEDANFYDLSNPSSGNPTSGNFRMGNF